jgi:hypothetical protein
VSGKKQSAPKQSAPKQSFAESFARKIYAAVAAMLAATVARKVVERVWLKTTGKVPPDEPASPEVQWKEAVGWSALSGTAVGVARLLATRKAAGAWERVSDDDPSTHDGETEKAASRSRD